MKVEVQDILKYFPIKKPYQFVDEIISVDETHIEGAYRFAPDEYFYKGHFPGYAVTPGAILMEAAAQVGLLAFGMYLLGNEIVTLSEIPQDLLPTELSRMPPMLDILSIMDNEMPPDIPKEIFTNLFFLSSSEMSYKKVVLPGERVVIRADKVFFKFNKLKCNVRIVTEQDELVCKGIISGIIVKNKL